MNDVNNNMVYDNHNAVNVFYNEPLGQSIVIEGAGHSQDAHHALPTVGNHLFEAQITRGAQLVQGPDGIYIYRLIFVDTSRQSSETTINETRNEPITSQSLPQTNASPDSTTNTISMPSEVLNFNGQNNVSGIVPQIFLMPEPVFELLEDEPVYVNPKQYKRILKRREAQAKLEARGLIPKERRKYLHESRHKHAMSRVRGEDGRFQKKDKREQKKNIPAVTATVNRIQSDETICSPEFLGSDRTVEECENHHSSE